MKFEKSAEFGFGLHYSILTFNDTFHKSAYQEFKKFFLENREVKKWMIHTDYAFGDKIKNNDVVTFTFYPYLMKHEDLFEMINVLSRKDIKDTREVNGEFLKFIKNSPILNVSIILSRKRKLSYFDERDYFNSSLNKAIEQLKYWEISTPEGKDYFSEIIEKFKVLQKVVKSPSANLKIIRDIEIISQLVAYLCLEINVLIDTELIGWFSDRDKILDYKKAKFDTPLIFDFIHNIYHVLCDNNSDIKGKKSELIFVTPEKSGVLFYDDLNRIPDYICGALADYDMKKKKFSHSKFEAIHDTIFLNNYKNIIFKMDFSKKGFSTENLYFYSV